MLTLIMATACAAFVAGVLSAHSHSTDLVYWEGEKPAGGWRRWFPRAEVSPRLEESAEGGGMLMSAGGGSAYAIGGWERPVSGISAGKAFNLHAEVECEGMSNAPRSLWVRLYWTGNLPEGTAPEVARMTAAGAGRWVFHDRAVAPEGATGALVRLIYRWEAGGRAVWHNISMTPAGPEAPGRMVRVSTIHRRGAGDAAGSGVGRIEANLAAYLEMVDRAGEAKPDFVLLPEGMVSVGVGLGDLEAVSEKLPEGRFFQALARRAREHKTHICYGTYEREEACIFNTACLIDRDGRMAGRYRKNHLPLEEDVAGLAPGGGFEVFDTDVCRVGIIICFESEFPEAMRVQALEGAEIVLVPIWGGHEETLKTRARENGVYVATSSFDMRSMVIDRQGKAMAAAGGEAGEGVASAVCDLDAREKAPWTGEFQSYFARMRRPELFGRLTRP